MVEIVLFQVQAGPGGCPGVSATVSVPIGVVSFVSGLPLVDVLSVGYTLCLLLTLIADEAQAQRKTGPGVAWVKLGSPYNYVGFLC